MSVNISSLAYAKIILHAARYPHAAINGVLLANKDDIKNKIICVVDAIPLFHSFLTLAPMLEAALYQVIIFNILIILIFTYMYSVHNT